MNLASIVGQVLVCLLALQAGAGAQEARQGPAYPQSEYIRGLELDWSTFKHLAPGSDNWQLTWAADDNQYTVWGDGGGFGGTNEVGRVSLGVARIEGPKENFRGVNVYGGANCEAQAEITGKSYGILAIGNKLYMWVGPGSGGESFKEARLYESRDYGHTWKGADWAFSPELRFGMPTFCQFGKGYDGARDGYVYIYVPRLPKVLAEWGIQKPGKIDLLRVPKDKLMDRSAYEAYAGKGWPGKVKWSKDLSKRRAVFEDASGVGPHCSVSYNAGLKRYLLATEHTESHKGNLGVYEAPEPWGPWHTVAYWTNFAPPGHEATLFYMNFSNKWCSKDGRKVVVVLTGTGYNDAWESVEGELRVNHQ